MKKIVLSAGVIVSFIVYSLLMRQSSAGSVVSLVAQQPTTSTPAAPTVPDNTPPTTPSSPAPSTPATTYRDGSYVGSVADAFYGNIQVEAIIQSGQITDVRFLQYPNDQPNSVAINQDAMPLLKEEAIQAQSAQVDGVSGATDTSQAFVESLSSALAKALES